METEKKMRYWYHPESDDAWASEEDETGPFVHEITEKAYRAFLRTNGEEPLLSPPDLEA